MGNEKFDQRKVIGQDSFEIGIKYLLKFAYI